MDFQSLNITDLQIGRLGTREMGMGTLRVDSMQLDMRVPAYIWCLVAAVLALVGAVAVSTVLHHRRMRRVYAEGSLLRGDRRYEPPPGE